MAFHMSLKLALFFFCYSSCPSNWEDSTTTLFPSSLIVFPLDLMCREPSLLNFQFSYCILQLCESCLILLNIFCFFVEMICLCIAILTSVNIFMTVIFNSMSDKRLICFIKIDFWGFILFFCLEHILLLFYFPSLSVLLLSSSPSLDKLTLCRRWTLSIKEVNLGQVPHCLWNFCDCLSYWLCS